MLIGTKGMRNELTHRRIDEEEKRIFWPEVHGARSGIVLPVPNCLKTWQAIPISFSPNCMDFDTLHWAMPIVFLWS